VLALKEKSMEDNAGLMGSPETSELAQKQEETTVLIKDDRASATPDAHDEEDGINWEKRYGDVRRYMDQQLKERDTVINDLQKQVEAGRTFSIPSSVDDLEEMKESNPDYYEALKKGAEVMYQKDLNEIRRDATKIKKEAEMIKLERKHSDYEEIKSSPDFKDWLGKQPGEVQDWMYKRLDSNLWIRVQDEQRTKY
jgi:hypothetical protein